MTRNEAREILMQILYEMDAAKEILFGINLPVSEIAYSLGFDYPQYFCRLFKKSTGMSPSEYRLSLTR